jgi:hypothetical protein
MFKEGIIVSMVDHNSRNQIINLIIMIEIQIYGTLLTNTRSLLKENNRTGYKNLSKERSFLKIHLVGSLNLNLETLLATPYLLVEINNNLLNKTKGRNLMRNLGCLVFRMELMENRMIKTRSHFYIQFIQMDKDLILNLFRC